MHVLQARAAAELDHPKGLAVNGHILQRAICHAQLRESREATSPVKS
jgi:hypothetical protein